MFVLHHILHQSLINVDIIWSKFPQKVKSVGSNFTVLFNLLRPKYAIWRHRTGSTLAQVMACCLAAPSHYLNQCWLIVSKVHWHSNEGNLTQDTLTTNHLYYLENYLSKFSFKSPRSQWVKGPVIINPVMTETKHCVMALMTDHIHVDAPLDLDRLTRSVLSML